MDFNRFDKQLEFLSEVDKLKQIFRNTVLMDESRRENDAEHNWHMAVCALLFAEYANEKDLDMLKVLKMILIHDIVEIDAGDTFAYDEKGHEDKADREQRAAQRIFGLLPDDQRDEFMGLWNEFEEYETPASKLAHLADTFMPIYHNYKTKGLQWKKMNITKERVLKRNNHIQRGSEEIWNYTQSIVSEAEEKGYFQKSGE